EPKLAPRASEAVEKIIAPVKIATKSTFIAEFALRHLITVHAAYGPVRILRIKHILAVMPAENEVAILVLVRVVGVVAVLGIRGNKRYARHFVLEAFQFFDKPHMASIL
ncbi:MAG: hypothetical protein ACD_51C00027G0002, partial [uncultured bacterium]